MSKHKSQSQSAGVRGRALIELQVVGALIKAAVEAGYRFDKRLPEDGLSRLDNDGWDLVSDYSTNLKTFLEPVQAVADFWGQ